MVLVYGVVHPPLRDTCSTDRSWFFEKDELESLRSLFYDKPVCLNHNRLIVAGSVLNLALDDRGNLGAYLFIDTHTLPGRVAMRRIEQGISLGLSVQFYFGENPNAMDRVANVTAIEISIVRHPLHPGSRILKYGNRHSQSISNSGFGTIILEMDATNDAAIESAVDKEDRRMAAMELAKEWEKQGINAAVIVEFMNHSTAMREAERKKLDEMLSEREQLEREEDAWSVNLLKKELKEGNTGVMMATRIACSKQRKINALEKTILDFERERVAAAAAAAESKAPPPTAIPVTPQAVARPPIDAGAASAEESRLLAIKNKTAKLTSNGHRQMAEPLQLSSSKADIDAAYENFKKSKNPPPTS